MEVKNNLYLEGIAALSALPSPAYDETDEQFKLRILATLGRSDSVYYDPKMRKLLSHYRNHR